MKIKYPDKDDPRWVEGKPDELVSGMFVQACCEGIILIGDHVARGDPQWVEEWDEHVVTHYIPISPIEVEDSNE